MRRPHGAITRPMARKSLRSACSWSSLPDDVGRHADERAQRRRRPDAVLPAVPGRAEHHRHLLEVVHEEPLRVVEERPPTCAGPPNASLANSFFSSCASGACATRPRPTPSSLISPCERRILALVERAHHVVRRGQRFVAVQLAARQADEVRCVEPRVLGVDRDEHLDDVVLGQPVENDRRHRELVALDVLDVGVQRQQPVLAVDGAQDALTLRHLQAAHRGARPRSARTSASRRTR